MLVSLKKKINKALQVFRFEKRGAIAVEFALVVPVLLALFMGLVELSRFIIIFQKMDRVASTAADIVAQKETISESDMVQVWGAATLISEPFDIIANGYVIISAIADPDETGLKIQWQRNNGGTFGQASQFGAEGEDANLPAGFTVPDGDTVITGEAFYNYQPIVGDFIFAETSITIRRDAFFRPRLGTLQNITP